MCEIVLARSLTDCNQEFTAASSSFNALQTFIRDFFEAYARSTISKYLFEN